jgi:transposase InsO family protein
MTRGLKLRRVFATRWNELIGMDLFCGLLESDTGYQNILVMTDYVTKYVVAVLLFSKTAEEVAQEFVDKWYLIYGWPERIQTDQGGEFTGKVLKRITEAARVKRSTTTPYHLQANGQVERTNKTIA